MRRSKRALRLPSLGSRRESSSNSSLGAYEAKAAGVDIGKVVEAMHEAPVPPAKDKTAGRDRAIEVFVTSDLFKALNRRNSKNGWTLSETVEHACAMAKKAETLAAELEALKART